MHAPPIPRLVDLVHAFKIVVVEQFKKRVEKLLNGCISYQLFSICYFESIFILSRNQYLDFFLLTPPPRLLFTSPKLTFNSHESESFVPGQYWNQNIWHPVRFYACPRFAQRYYLPRAGKWNWTFKFLIIGLTGIKNQFKFGLAGRPPHAVTGLLTPSYTETIWFWLAKIDSRVS